MHTSRENKEVSHVEFLRLTHLAGQVAITRGNSRFKFKVMVLHFRIFSNYEKCILALQICTIVSPVFVVCFSVKYQTAVEITKTIARAQTIDTIFHFRFTINVLNFEFSPSMRSKKYFVQKFRKTTKAKYRSKFSRFHQ